MTEQYEIEFENDKKQKDAILYLLIEILAIEQQTLTRVEKNLTENSTEASLDELKTRKRMIIADLISKFG